MSNKRKIAGQVAPNETIVGILSILDIASADGARFKDVLDGLRKQQNAATMIEVAWRFTGGVRPKTKTEAHRRLVTAYNKRAAAKFAQRKMAV